MNGFSEWVTRQGETRQGETRQGETRQGETHDRVEIAIQPLPSAPPPTTMPTQ